MKKLIISLAVALLAAAGAYAQKFALVDMDYILRNVPSYEMANEQDHSQFLNTGLNNLT